MAPSLNRGCVKFECTCPYGTPVDFKQCKVDGSNQCQSCNTGYRLTKSDKTCQQFLEANSELYFHALNRIDVYGYVQSLLSIEDKKLRAEVVNIITNPIIIKTLIQKMEEQSPLMTNATAQVFDKFGSQFSGSKEKLENYCEVLGLDILTECPDHLLIKMIECQGDGTNGGICPKVGQCTDYPDDKIACLEGNIKSEIFDILVQKEEYRVYYNLYCQIKFRNDLKKCKNTLMNYVKDCSSMECYEKKIKDLVESMFG